jgi:hypothetical protein
MHTPTPQQLQDRAKIAVLREHWRAKVAALGPLDIAAELQRRADAAGLTLEDWAARECADADD